AWDTTRSGRRAELLHLIQPVLRRDAQEASKRFESLRAVRSCVPRIHEPLNAAPRGVGRVRTPLGAVGISGGQILEGLDDGLLGNMRQTKGSDAGRVHDPGADAAPRR